MDHEEGRKLIELVSQEDVDVLIGAWVKKYENRYWHLYVAASSNHLSIKEERFRIAHRALSQLIDPSASLIDFHVIEPSDPIALGLLAIRDRYPRMVATKLKTRRTIGNLDTRGLYIYPPNFEMTPPGEIVHSVLRLLDRTGSASPSVVTFKDGSTIHAVPIGIRLNTPEGARIDWRDVVTSRERSVAADEVVSIL